MTARLPFEYADPASVQTAGFRIDLPVLLGGKSGLMQAYAMASHAPGAYFGNNWDAFFDILCDLRWITEREVLIAHADLPRFEGDDLRLYLETLRDAISEWAEINRDASESGEDGPDDLPLHNLRVVFPEAQRAAVEAALGA